MNATQVNEAYKCTKEHFKKFKTAKRLAEILDKPVLRILGKYARKREARILNEYLSDLSNLASLITDPSFEPHHKVALFYNIGQDDLGERILRDMTTFNYSKFEESMDR